MEIESRISPDTVTRQIDLGHTINFSLRSAGMGSLYYRCGRMVCSANTPT